MDTFYKLIQEVRLRPAFYLGDTPSLTKFWILVYGYSLARRSFNTETNANDFDFQNFTNWMHQIYKEMSYSMDWYFLIVSMYGDEVGFEKFFEFFDKFEEQKNLGTTRLN